MSTAMSKPRKVVSYGAQYVILGIVAVIVLAPIMLVVIGGLKTRGEQWVSPYTIPNPPRFENWLHILNMPSFWQMMANSLFVMILTAGGVLIVSSMAAFIFARMAFRGRDVIMNILTVGLLFPLIVAILPVYLVLRQVGLLNNLWGLILPEVGFALAGNIIILRGFFRSIPSELQDAAYVDGCSAAGFFWRIMLPLSRPALGAVTALVMISSWNEPFLPLLVLDKDTLWTLPLGTMQFRGQYGQDWSLVLAFVTLTMIPTIIFYLLAERQIVSGLTAGAVKG